MDAGINPFIEIDVDNLPADGAPWATYHPTRKIYGNIVDGIRGQDIQLKSDGTLHYKTNTDDALQATQTTIDGRLLTSYNLDKDIKIFLYGSQLGPESSGSQTSTALTYFTDVLAGGAHAGIQAFAPGAANKFHAFWMQISSDLAGAAGGQNYTLTFTEETTATAYGTICFNSLSQPARIVLGFVGTTDDKDLLMQVAGGNGNENIFGYTCAGTF